MSQGCAGKVHPASERHHPLKVKDGIVSGCPREGVFQVHTAGEDGQTRGGLGASPEVGVGKEVDSTQWQGFIRPHT